MSTEPDNNAEIPRPRRTAGAFDIRAIIALLFAIYGVVLVLLGVVATTTDITKAAGVNINLDAGIGMLVVAVAFFAWARLRPITVPNDPEE